MYYKILKILSTHCVRRTLFQFQYHCLMPKSRNPNLKWFKCTETYHFTSKEKQGQEKIQVRLIQKFKDLKDSDSFTLHDPLPRRSASSHRPQLDSHQKTVLHSVWPSKENAFAYRIKPKSLAIFPTMLPEAMYPTGKCHMLRVLDISSQSHLWQNSQITTMH